MKRHKKHADLQRRNFGHMASHEIAILGTKCDLIKALVQKISIKLDHKFKIAYADASHNQDKALPSIDNFTFHTSGSLNTELAYEMNSYLNRIQFSPYDLLFINGNHYQGKNQILILDEEKEASVLKRLDQLDNIQFLINLNNKSKTFDFLLDKYPHIDHLKIYHIEDIEQICAHIYKLIEQNTAKVQGLVLAGGKSLRMGQDKGLLDYFGKSQRVYSAELLEKLNLKTFLSVRKEQKLETEKVIEDTFFGLGPFGAICSAFQHDPNKAWLVLATDLPYVDEKLIRKLLNNRDPSKVATALKGKSKNFPEPLITIWEPKAYPIMLQFLAQGISCPRKVLINSDVKIVEVQDDYIVNVNTPEEFRSVKNDLKK
jgi:molybdopterin-guanine dinucleotide biosynthesis protein A